MSQISEFLQTAEPIVRDAGEIAKQFFGKPIRCPDKAGGEIVTETDREVEKLIFSQLKSAFPDHGFLGEESGEQDLESEFVWILDPIDGTRYFASGVPLYSISLALRQGDDLIAGIVYNPESNQFFSAGAGLGATLNNTLIRCSEVTELRDAILCVEIPHRHYPTEIITEALGHISSIIGHVDRIRIIGVSALGLCYCASGGFDAYLNISTGSKTWDLAAGKFILKEAGGLISTTAKNQFVGGPPPLHDALQKLLDLPLIS